MSPLRRPLTVLADLVRAAPRLATGVALLVLAVAVAGVVLTHAVASAPRPVTGHVDAAGAQARLEALRASLGPGLAGTGAPATDVVRHVSVTASTVAGTLALPDSAGRCWGFTVTATASWVRTGDPAGLRLGPVGALTGTACRR